MSTLYITEFERMGHDSRGVETTKVRQPPLAEQTVTIGATANTPANVLSTRTTIVRLFGDVACGIMFTPVGAGNASAGSMRMAANSAEYFVVAANSNLTVSVIN